MFKGVHVLEGTGLAVLRDPVGMLPAVAQAIDRAHQGGAQCVILAGAVFAGYKALMAEHGLPTSDVIDCVEASAEALVRQALGNPP